MTSYVQLWPFTTLYVHQWQIYDQTQPHATKQGSTDGCFGSDLWGCQSKITKIHCASSFNMIFFQIKSFFKGVHNMTSCMGSIAVTDWLQQWKDCTIPHQIPHLEFRVNHTEINTLKEVQRMQKCTSDVQVSGTCLHVGISACRHFRGLKVY